MDEHVSLAQPRVAERLEQVDGEHGRRCRPPLDIDEIDPVERQVAALAQDLAPSLESARWVLALLNHGLP
jgi:hypothetical protein